MQIHCNRLIYHCSDFLIIAMKNKTRERNSNSPILQRIETIAKEAKGSKLTPEFIRKIAPEAAVVMSQTGCNRIQAVLLSVICNLNFTKSSVDIEALSDYLECPPVTVGKYLNELEGLCGKKILRSNHAPQGPDEARSVAPNRISFWLEPGALDLFLKGRDLKAPLKRKPADSYELIGQVSSLMGSFNKSDLGETELKEKLDFLLKTNCRMAFVRRLEGYDLNNDDRFVLFYMIHSYLTGEDHETLPELAQAIYPDMRRRLDLRRRFTEGCHPLLEKGLVSLEDGIFGPNRMVKLLDEALSLIYSTEQKVFMGSRRLAITGLITAASIEKKKLFFNDEERRQLGLLRESLDPANYPKVVGRLSQSGLRTGFTVLLHGSPGVGKTEAVYQVARETGRDISAVSIADTKSMWYGESEKLIKGVFTEYRKLSETSKTAPILLFNEADGIFSTRKGARSSSIDQTENAIQNIILQELEDFTGILMATTNLPQNLDKAFDRRFLYKILFTRPSAENRLRIWKERLREVPVKVLEKVAAEFDLTGGEIDNIARKMIMQKTLYGKADIGLLEEFCRAECLSKRTFTPVGYKIH